MEDVIPASDGLTLLAGILAPRHSDDRPRAAAPGTIALILIVPAAGWRGRSGPRRRAPQPGVVRVVAALLCAVPDGDTLPDGKMGKW
jgi:hypothetical protein